MHDIRQTGGSLSGGQRPAFAVAKAVMLDARLVTMDESTAALGASQTAFVLA
jgi:ABC-type sugar transport system ATPase subunit